MTFQSFGQISYIFETYNIIFAKFFEILLNNNVVSPHIQIVDKAKIIWESFDEFIFSEFFIKGTTSPKCLKMHLKNSTRLGFR